MKSASHGDRHRRPILSVLRRLTRIFASRNCYLYLSQSSTSYGFSPNIETDFDPLQPFCSGTRGTCTTVAFISPTVACTKMHTDQVGGRSKAYTNHTSYPHSRPTSSFIHVPAHRDFREKYFQGFKKPSDAGSRWRNSCSRLC
jgi:hypothetical protein